MKIKLNFELNLEKIIFIIISIGMICCIMYLGFLSVQMLDSNKDIKMCKIGMKSTTKNNVQCFANEDFFKINFGNNIDCTCFYWEGINYKQNKFKID